MAILDFIESICVQTAVYWGNPQPDGYGGETFDPPIEINCRWTSTNELIRAGNGEQVVTKGKILSPTTLEEGGYLYLGSLDDLDSEQQENPKEIPEACRIIQYGTTPLLRSTDEFVKRAFI